MRMWVGGRTLQGDEKTFGGKTRKHKRADGLRPALKGDGPHVSSGKRGKAQREREVDGGEGRGMKWGKEGFCEPGSLIGGPGWGGYFIEKKVSLPDPEALVP